MAGNRGGDINKIRTLCLQHGAGVGVAGGNVELLADGGETGRVDVADGDDVSAADITPAVHLVHSKKATADESAAKVGHGGVVAFNRPGAGQLRV